MKDIHLLAIAAGALLLASKKKSSSVGKLYDTDGGRVGVWMSIGKTSC